MTRRRRWARRAGRAALGLALLGGPGCLQLCNPIVPPGKELTEVCAALPDPCRNHVHIFLVHGLDPCDKANLSGLQEWLWSIGFLKTYYGQFFHSHSFTKEIRRLHQDDPSARFVLLGFSLGANMARDIANHVAEDGISIDLLVYCGGNTLHNVPKDQPANALRIYNILAVGCIWNGDTMDRAENVNLDNVLHFGSPAHPRTLEMLARELAIVAARVPVPCATAAAPFGPPHTPLPPGARRQPPAPEEAPPPRRLEPDGKGEWDFLRPQPATDLHRRLPYPGDFGTTVPDPASPSSPQPAEKPAPSPFLTEKENAPKRPRQEGGVGVAPRMPAAD